jgi:hypothetical protein
VPKEEYLVVKMGWQNKAGEDYVLVTTGGMIAIFQRMSVW